MCLRCHRGIWELFFWKRREFIGAPQTDLYDPWVFTRLLFFSILTWKAAFNAKCTLFYGTVEHRNVGLNVLLWDWNIMMSAKLGIYVHCHSQDIFFKWKQKNLFLLFQMCLEHWWSWVLWLCFHICVFITVLKNIWNTSSHCLYSSMLLCKLLNF